MGFSSSKIATSKAVSLEPTRQTEEINDSTDKSAKINVKLHEKQSNYDKNWSNALQTRILKRKPVTEKSTTTNKNISTENLHEKTSKFDKENRSQPAKEKPDTGLMKNDNKNVNFNTQTIALNHVPPALKKPESIHDTRQLKNIDNSAFSNNIRKDQTNIGKRLEIRPMKEKSDTGAMKHGNDNKNMNFNTRPNDLQSRHPILKKEDLIPDVKQFEDIDNHAKKAPKRFRDSLPDLVQYLCKPSSDQLYHVRAFYVWIANNIRYDVDGYFGITEMASCNPWDVLRSGSSVCDGYAGLMEAMCKEAEIKAKKISGYAKGYSYCAGSPLTTSHKTNHAWNAVYLRENWFLLDNTWGAGHVDKETQMFVKEFKEFYFLTDPQQFVYSHFPYMNNDMEESVKWQLLEKPWTLDWYNQSLKIRGEAFRIGVLPKSHKEAIVSFEDELELTFSQDNKDNEFLTSLYQRKEALLYEVKFSTHMCISDQEMILKIRPPESGDYRLRVFGRKLNVESSEKQKHSMLFEYVLHCIVPAEKSQLRRCPYPETYVQAFTDKCQVLEPLGEQIPANTEIKMRFRSPYLQRMMIYKMMLKKDGDVFEGTIKTPDSNYLIKVYGSRLNSGSLQGQFQFCVG